MKIHMICVSTLCLPQIRCKRSSSEAKRLLRSQSLALPRAKVDVTLLSISGLISAFALLREGERLLPSHAVY